MAAAQMAPGKVWEKWIAEWPLYFVTSSIDVTWLGSDIVLTKSSSWRVERPTNHEDGKMRIQTTMNPQRIQVAIYNARRMADELDIMLLMKPPLLSGSNDWCCVASFAVEHIVILSAASKNENICN